MKLKKIVSLYYFLIILISCSDARSLTSDEVFGLDNISLVTAVSFDDSSVVVIKQEVDKKPDKVFLFVLDLNLNILEKREYRNVRSGIPTGVSPDFFVCDIFGSIGTIIFNSDTKEIIEADVPFPALGKIHISGNFAYVDGAGKSAPAVLNLDTGEMFRKDSIPFSAGSMWIENNHVYIFSHPGWVDEDKAIELFNDGSYQEIQYDQKKEKAARTLEDEWNPKGTATTLKFQKLLNIPIYRY